MSGPKENPGLGRRIPIRANVEKKAGPLNAKGSAEVKGGVSHSVTITKVVTWFLLLCFL